MEAPPRLKCCDVKHDTQRCGTARSPALRTAPSPRFRPSFLLGLFALCAAHLAACLVSFEDRDAAGDSGLVDVAPADAGQADADAETNRSDSGLDASPDAEVLCGNCVIDVGEDCDGTDLAGETCRSQGYALGTLACDACAFDRSDCNNNCGGSNQPLCPASFHTDDFDDGVRGGLWDFSFQNGGATYAETGGELVLTLPASGTGYAAYFTGNAFDLRDDAITIEVLEVPDPCCEEAEFEFMVSDSIIGDYAGISASAGGIRGFYNVNNSSSDISPITYSQADHRFWRIRETAGIFYWETSPDGLQWDTRGFMANPIAMDAVQIGIQAGCWDPVPTPGAVRVDNYNLLP